MFQLNAISNILFATTLVNLIGSYFSWQRDKSKPSVYFALTLSFATIWTLAAALDYAFIPIHLKIIFAKIEALGYNYLLAFFFLFVLHHTGNENWLKNIAIKFLVYVFPTSNILLIWTNEWHNGVWSGFTRVPNNESLVIFHQGPAYPYAYISYLTILIILISLWRATQQGSVIAKRQSLILFIATLLPVIFNLIYQLQIFNMPGVDWSSITFSLTGITWMIALFRTHLLNLLPIARHTLIQKMKDSVLVFDDKNKLIDFNIAASSLLGLKKESIGIDAKTVLVELPQLLSLVTTHPQNTIPLELHLDQKVFDLRLTNLKDSLDNIIGKMIVLRDITQRYQTENLLKERTIELQNTVQKLEQEITTREKIELELKKLNHAIEQAASSVLITDQNGLIVYVNPWTLELTGYTLDEILGKNPSIFQSELTPRETFDDLWKTLETGYEWRGTFINKKKNGEIYWEHCIISPVRDTSGKTINYIAVKEDITERIKLEKELKELAVTDSLTGALNRREITRLINQELARANRYEHSTSVIMLDIDYFKEINDRFGHIAGDIVIQQTAETLHGNLRKTDSLGRYGGDEFIILLPETNIDQAHKMAKKLLKLIRGVEIFHQGQIIKITSSMGVGNIDDQEKKPDDPEPDFQTILSLADKALYRAKEAGRNCVM